jgi:YHS domain-containing protein
VQDPKLYIQQLELTVPCVIAPERNAVLDSAHRTLIGYESYFFSDLDAKARFDREPEKFCGPLTDPVTLRHFNPNSESPRLIHNERLYIFATDSSRTAFVMMPGMYQFPEHKMLPADTIPESL